MKYTELILILLNMHLTFNSSHLNKCSKMCSKFNAFSLAECFGNLLNLAGVADNATFATAMAILAAKSYSWNFLKNSSPVIRPGNTPLNEWLTQPCPEPKRTGTSLVLISIILDWKISLRIISVMCCCF